MSELDEQRSRYQAFLIDSWKGAVASMMSQGVV